MSRRLIVEVLSNPRGQLCIKPPLIYYLITVVQNGIKQFILWQLSYSKWKYILATRILVFGTKNRKTLICNLATGVGAPSWDLLLRFCGCVYWEVGRCSNTVHLQLGYVLISSANHLCLHLPRETLILNTWIQKRLRLRWRCEDQMESYASFPFLGKEDFKPVWGVKAASSRI